MEYRCPLCNTLLVQEHGEKIHPGDPAHGVSLLCPAEYPRICSAQEVMGHGRTSDEAFRIIQQKYVK